MQLFAISDMDKPDVVLGKVKEHYHDNYYNPDRGTIFVASNGETSKEVAQKVGIIDPKLSSGIVILISGYWGHHDKQLWEWLSIKGKANGG